MEIKRSMEIIQLKPWHFKVRRKNKKGNYDIILRRDKTAYCSCNSHKYNKEECTHIETILAMVAQYSDEE